MPCYTPSNEEQIEKLLCASCRFLSVEQLSAVDGLMDWYSEHLRWDHHANLHRPHEAEMYEKELNRIGYKKIKDYEFNVPGCAVTQVLYAWEKCTKENYKE